jgi:hypothetical protein
MILCGDNGAMRRRTTGTPIVGLPVASMLAALTASLALAASAGASPVWKFNGAALVGEEKIIDHATKSSLTFLGLTITCSPFVYDMTIFNEGGTGRGNVTAMPLSNCFTNSKVCTVDAIKAESLPWPAKLTTVSASHYIVIEGVKLSILFGGEECVLGGITATVKGTAGGLIDNSTETTTFSSSSFKATKTSLTAFGEPVEWIGAFTMAALGAHKGEALTVS